MKCYNLLEDNDILYLSIIYNASVSTFSGISLQAARHLFRSLVSLVEMKLRCFKQAIRTSIPKLYLWRQVGSRPKVQTYQECLKFWAQDQCQVSSQSDAT